MSTEERTVDMHQQAPPATTVPRGVDPADSYSFRPAPPTPTPAKPRRLVFVAPVVVLAALAGGVGGFVVADDADEIADLEEQVADATDAAADLEGDLQEERDLRAEQDDQLDECQQAAEATATLVADVETLEDAYDAYMAAPLGSDEELRAWLLLGESLIEVFGTSSAADQANGTCLVETAG